MNRGSTLFLRITIILIATLVLLVCIYGIPRVVGQFDIGGYDPILLGLYLPAIPFFCSPVSGNEVAPLYQIITKLLLGFRLGLFLS